MIKYEIKTALASSEIKSIAELARLSKVREASLSEFLSGKRKNISIVNLERIMIVLGLQVNIN